MVNTFIGDIRLIGLKPHRLEISLGVLGCLQNSIGNESIKLAPL